MPRPLALYEIPSLRLLPWPPLFTAAHLCFAFALLSVFLILRVMSKARRLEIKLSKLVAALEQATDCFSAAGCIHPACIDPQSSATHSALLSLATNTARRLLRSCFMSLH